MKKTILGAALAAITLAGMVTAAGSVASAGAVTPSPHPTPLPNGLSRSEAIRLASSGPVGDCANSGVHCKPDISGSCTGNTSQTTPPATIRVYVPSVAGYPNRIQTIPFETYVENVLPNEWSATWDGDSLKAGAVAITSYTWYWATHFGGYIGTDPTDKATCFDVTDDGANFQKYVGGSAQPNSTSKVQQVFPNAIRVGGNVLAAGYFDAVRTDYHIADPKTYDACGQGADGTFLSQSGSQTCNEDNTGNKWPVILKTYYGQDIQLATTAQLRTPHDFQYLHRSTPAAFANGVWTIEDGYPTTIAFGAKGEVPVVNTVGDGFARVGVYNPPTSTFYLGSPTGGLVTKFSVGRSGDVPVAAQYNGLSAPTQIGIFRPSNGFWYLVNSTGAVTTSVGWGTKGDIPVPADYTGDGKADIAVYRPSSFTYYIRGQAAVPYGTKGDIPVPADYAGDGKADIAVFRPSNVTFYIRGQAPIPYGTKGDVPVTGDFNGDGKADIAVYRPSTHTLYVRGQASTVLPAGTPIGAAPYHD